MNAQRIEGAPDHEPSCVCHIEKWASSCPVHRTRTVSSSSMEDGAPLDGDYDCQDCGVCEDCVERSASHFLTASASPYYCQTGSSTDARHAKHMARKVAGHIALRDDTGLRAYCSHCARPIVRDTTRSAQWREDIFSSTPTTGTP